MKNPAWKTFLKLCIKTRDFKTLSDVLDCLLTIDEKKEIANRYLILKSLLEGKLTQREMSEKLNVSIAKITRGSNTLKIMDQSLKKILSKN